MNKDEINKLCMKYWNEYEPGLRKICRIKLRSNPEDIEDVIQEVFLVFCKKANESGIPENPKAWIYGVFRNILNLKYREIYRKKEHETIITEKEYELPYEEDFTEMIVTKEAVSEINELIKEITTPEERQLLDYIYIRNFKMKETAEILGATEAAVKQKHYRLCRKIKKAVMKKYF